MASLTHAESRRLYSWWWDSHISPKNSKWLQENLKDMDTKVKLMIKLLEEDADSFARRAEMYYKKRPELMKLVEEFYRAYRALAERYVHATGALRQAQRTMAEAFPNQIPFAVIEDSPSSSSTAESDPRTPEMSIPLHSFSEPDDMQKDSLSQSAHFQGSKRNGTYSEENDALNSKRELKQLNEMFPSGDSISHPKFAKGKIRKGLNFQQEEDTVPEQKIHDVSRDIQKNGLGNKEAYVNTRSLRDELPSQRRNVKMGIKSELDILGKAESEIQRLQESLSRLESEKEATLAQYHKSMEKISNLEMEISHAQAESRKLKSEMLITLARLEKEKQALEMGVIDLAQYTNQQQELQNNDRMEKLHFEFFDKPNTLALEIQSPVNILSDTELKKHGLDDDIWQVKEVNSSLKKELQPTQVELGKINVSIQDERLLSVQAEEALQSLQKVHSQSQQEIKLLMFDLHSKVQMLKDVELKRHGLEEEIKQHRKRNEKLNDQVLSSALMISNLQPEILSLKETQLKLENEVEHNLHDNEALKQEVHYLKEEIATVELKHQHLMDQIEAVGLNQESFQASVKELQDGNLELKELCKKLEDENAILQEKLENMERVIEKNTILETSLSDANSQLEELRGKGKALEESSESLNNKMSDLISENGILVLQLENILKNMEKLSENNDFLGICLSEANVELERLRGRLKILEESSQSFLNENSNLQSEKNTLVLQVENIAASLENMKRSYAELEDKHLYLEQEKESTLLLVSELQNLLKLEKQQHEAFVMLSNNQLATLTDKMNLLQEEGQNRDEELGSVQHKLLNSQVEVFMLQKCLTDSKEKNTSLEKRCQEHLEASRLAEGFISQLETENLGQKKIIAFISEHNKKLKEAVQMVLNSLGIESACISGGTVYEEDGQQMLGEIIMMQNFISNILDENHVLLLEESVNITLLRQLRLVLTALNSEKNTLSLQCQTGNEQLLALKSEKNELLWINEQLRKDILASCLREENLKAEMETLGKQQLDLIVCHKTLQGENCDLVERRLLLEKNVLNLRNEIQMLEVENNDLIAEVVTLDFLSLILGKFCAERLMDLRVCSSNLGSLHDSNNDLEMKVSQMVQKFGVIEAENMLLKDSAVKLEDCQDHLLIIRNDLDMARSVHGQLNHQIEQLSHQMETEKGLLIQKDLELTEAKQKLRVMEFENMKLHRDLEAVKMNFDEAMDVREELEKSICMLTENNLHKDTEIANIHDANKMLSSDINNLSKELAVLTASKEHLSSELAYEIKSYEEEVARLLNDIHISSTHAFILEEKVLYLIGECERLEIIAMVQRKMIDEQIIQNSAYLGELMLKLEPLKSESEKLKVQSNAYLPLVLSLQSSTASLEHQVLSLVKHHGVDNHLTEDSSLAGLECDKSCQHPSEDAANTEAGVIVGLQKLQVMVEALRKVLVEHWDKLTLTNLNENAKSAAMKTDMKVPTPEKPLGEEEVQTKPCTIMELKEKLQETGKHPELQSCVLSSEGTHGPMMEDARLDHASHDVGSGVYHTGRLNNAENDDRMLELWEMTGRDLDNQMPTTFSISTVEDLDFCQTQAVEQDEAQHPSKQAAGKEVHVEKLEVPTKARFSRQDWNKKILECLASDAHRLSILLKSVQELKRSLENSEKSDPSSNMKYDSVKEQLKETEETISHLFATNSKLTNKVEDCCAPSDSKTGEEDEARNQQRRQVSARARRGSEKIGRLELELQRIQYIILRLSEEGENRTRATHGVSKVILRDYLYGRRERCRRKKGYFCGCVQPKTGGD